jgi:hypothetical protein
MNSEVTVEEAAGGTTTIARGATTAEMIAIDPLMNVMAVTETNQLSKMTESKEVAISEGGGGMIMIQRDRSVGAKMLLLGIVLNLMKRERNQRRLRLILV